MPELTLADVTLAYDVFGDGEPVVLVCGCGQPAVGWQLSVVPGTGGGRLPGGDLRQPGGGPVLLAPTALHRRRSGGRHPRAASTIWGSEVVRVAGYSMGGWVAETMAIRHPGRVRAAALIGSCNVATAWEKAITTVERDLARLGFRCPRSSTPPRRCATSPITTCRTMTSSTAGCP